MSMQLSLFGSRCAHVELPAVSLQSWSFDIPAEVSGMGRDLSVPLVVLHDQWGFASCGDYQIWRGKEPYFERPLLEGDVYSLEVPGRGTTAIHALPIPETISSWRRYVLRKNSRVLIGSAEHCDLCARGTRVVAAEHLRLDYVRQERHGHWRLSRPSSRGLCYVNDTLVSGTHDLAYGDIIDIVGLRLVFLGEVLAVEPPMLAGAALTSSLDMADEQAIKWAADVGVSGVAKEPDVLFSPAPRVAPDFDTEPVEIEGPPNQQNVPEQSLLATIGPAMTSVVPMAAAAALTTTVAPVGLPMMLASAASTAFWSRRNQKERKKEAERYERLRTTRYRDYLAAKRDEVSRAYHDNRTRLLERYPGAAVVAGYDARSAELWNRNRYQQDFGFVRLGLATGESPKPVNVPAQKFTLVEDDLVDGPYVIKDEFAFMEDVPVGLDLLDQSLFGIVGDGTPGGYAQVVRALLAQLATSYRYDDLKIAFICDGSREDDRSIAEAVRWLPHTWTDDRSFRFMANDPNSARTVLREIAAVAAERSVHADGKAVPAPHYAVFVLPGVPLGSTLASTYLLDPEGKLGFTTFVCAERFTQLPNACVQVIENNAQFRGAHTVREARADWLDIAFDDVPTGQLASLARRLCGIRLETPEMDQGIPSALTFCDLYGAQTVEDLAIAERWRTNAANESLSVPVGRGSAGVDYFFDIHEKYHGPHGLIAGTTGSGKSEMLMALVLSLAVSFGPDEVAFLLVDFKGGGLANHFERDGVPLPHVVGKITNLSGNAIQRALAAVRSENERRQRMLADARANDIYEYGRLYRNREVSEPMPHLLIVVDEFAELKSQFPEFIDELVSVATIGRALGVHLILATQKPAGVVSGTIEANANFRLCLRVQTKEDSKSMLDVPDAARDKLAMPPGRTLIKVGAGGYLEEFQSAFTRAPYVPGTVSSAGDVVRMRTLTGAVGQVPKGPSSAREDVPTQLSATVGLIIDYARDNDIPAARPLWMPELPERLGLGELGSLPVVGEWSIVARVGRYDQPHSQHQGVVAMDVTASGGYLVVGSNGSGKSVLLQTMLYDLMTTYDPCDLWVYALDFSGHLLDCLAGFPHVGGLLHDTDEEGIGKLFFLLDQLLAERRRLLAGGSFLQYRRHKGADLPAIVVAIDNYAALREKTSDAYAANVLRLAKQGPSCGIYLVMSTAGIGSAEVPAALAGNLGGRIALQLADRFAYRDLFPGSSVSVIPDLGTAGRGMALVGDEALEFQAALALDAADDFSRSECIAEAAEARARAWDGPHARRVPQIPADPTLSAYLADDEVKALLADDRSFPVGYDHTSAAPAVLDMSTFFCYVVSGKETAGRQNFMALVTRMAARKTDPANVYLLGTGRGACVKAAEDTGVTYLGPDADWTPLFDELRGEVMRRNARKHELEVQGLSDEELFEASVDDAPVFVLIEDLVAVATRLQADVSQAGVRNFLQVVVEKGWYHRIHVFAGLDQAESGPVRGDRLYQGITKDRAGMHFGGNVAGQQLLSFDYIQGFQQQSRVEPKHIGLPATGDLCRGTGRVVVPDASR